MQAIAVVGTKKSGKTTTIENLTRELTKRGYKVAAIKHINEPTFTIDTPGKDTWRYLQAGAKTIVATGQNQTITIENTGTQLAALLKKCKGNDIVFIEGFKKTIAKNQTITKIAVTKNPVEAENTIETYNPIIAFTGPYNTTNKYQNTPYANSQTNPKKLTNIIEKTILKK